MKRKNFIIVFVIFALMLVLISAWASSQDTIKTIQTDIRLHINTRNAKTDTIFDYYVSIGTRTIVKDFVTVDLKGVYERDNGTAYLSHYESASCKYGQTGYAYDTEKDVKLFYASIYYTLLKAFKAGYDFSIDQEINHSIYLGVRWEFVSAEIAFLNHVRRFKYLIDPTIKKWDRLSLKASIELSLNYKMN